MAFARFDSVLASVVAPNSVTRYSLVSFPDDAWNDEQIACHMHAGQYVHLDDDVARRVRNKKFVFPDGYQINRTENSRFDNGTSVFMFRQKVPNETAEYVSAKALCDRLCNAVSQMLAASAVAFPDAIWQPVKVDIVGYSLERYLQYGGGSPFTMQYIFYTITLPDPTVASVGRQYAEVMFRSRMSTMLFPNFWANKSYPVHMDYDFFHDVHKLALCWYVYSYNTDSNRRIADVHDDKPFGRSVFNNSPYSMYNVRLFQCAALPADCRFYVHRTTRCTDAMQPCSLIISMPFNASGRWEVNDKVQEKCAEVWLNCTRAQLLMLPCDPTAYYDEHGRLQHADSPAVCGLFAASAQLRPPATRSAQVGDEEAEFWHGAETDRFEFEADADADAAEASGVPVDTNRFPAVHADFWRCEA